MSYNLPDNVREDDPRAPWNERDIIPQMAVCRECGRVDELRNFGGYCHCGGRYDVKDDEDSFELYHQREIWGEL